LGGWDKGGEGDEGKQDYPNTTNVDLALGKTLVVGLVSVSTIAPAVAFARPAITDIAPPSIAPQRLTTALPFSQCTHLRTLARISTNTR
jgi:hypothetical protein